MPIFTDRQDESWCTDFNLKPLSPGKRLVDSIFGLKEADSSASFLIPEIEKFITNTRVKRNHKHSHKFYVTWVFGHSLFSLFPTTWNYEIFCPEVQLFQGDERTKQKYYYYGIFHEMIHWTGTHDRLNRKPNYPQDKTTNYACEEIVATIGAGVLLQRFGLLDDEMQKRLVEYIDGYSFNIIKHLISEGKIDPISGAYYYDYYKSPEYAEVYNELSNMCLEAIKYIESLQK